MTGGDIRGIAYVSQIGDTDMSAPLYKITKKYMMLFLPTKVGLHNVELEKSVDTSTSI